LDGNKYIGHRVTLYCDPTVQFGNEIVGGLRISHMTGIDKPLKVPLLIKRGKSAMFTVQPLKEAPKVDPTPALNQDWHGLTDVAGGDPDTLRAIWIDAKAAGADAETLDYIRNQARADA
jgi:hypothetical protein